jgi:hypothetical protein
VQITAYNAKFPASHCDCPRGVDGCEKVTAAPFLVASISFVALGFLAALAPAIIAMMLVTRWPASAEMLADVEGYDYHAIQFVREDGDAGRSTDKGGGYAAWHTAHACHTHTLTHMRLRSQHATLERCSHTGLRPAL